MKKMLIAGNWKMHTNYKEAQELALAILSGVNEISNLQSKILLCPPFTNLFSVKEVIQSSVIELGAQNCHFEQKGAFTGETSPKMLYDLGCKYVIIGHSERRTYFNEDDILINKKVISAINTGINVILCIGETIEQRQNSETFNILEHQLKYDLKELDSANLRNIVIAYEPVWAIGTGISATTEQIEEAHQWIKRYLYTNYREIANDLLILYGGSMNDKNALEIFKIEDVNGGLIGGASLKSEVFLNMIESSEKVLNN